jgi:hypothetical protein
MPRGSSESQTGIGSSSLDVMEANVPPAGGVNLLCVGERDPYLKLVFRIAGRPETTRGGPGVHEV